MLQTSRSSNPIDLVEACRKEKYHKGKQNLHGYKVEVSVVPSGFAIGYSAHYPYSTSDLTILQTNQEWPQTEVENGYHGHSLQVKTGKLSAEYPKSSDVLADKGYQGAAEFQRVIHPKKKAKNGELTRSE